MKNIIFFIFVLFLTTASAQENLGYQKPPKEILDLVDVPQAPAVIMDDDNTYMVLLYRDSYKTIAELSEKELRLGGLRINPKTNIGSRVNFYNNVKIRKMKDGNREAMSVKNMPSTPRLSNFVWSPDQQKMALTHTTNTGVEVWVMDLATMSMKRLTEAKVNANMGAVMRWFEDGESLLVKMLAPNRKSLINTSSAVPTGPTISTNDGKKAQNRTYQDLLKNKNDEFNFEQLALSELHQVSLDGTSKKWLSNAIYSGMQFSPDGEYIMINTVEKPFSYLVPYSRFPSKTTIYRKDGSKVQTVLEVPLIEDLPKGFMAVRTGKRNFSWRADMPATLIYAKALDGGDPANKVPYRDEVFQLLPPFSGDGTALTKTINRYSGIIWGNDKTAILRDYWWNTRNTKTYVFNPMKPDQTPKILFDLNYQDRYSDPGNFVTKRNDLGSFVLDIDGSTTYLMGAGFSKEGQFPFVHKFDLETKEKSTIYKSTYTDKKENLQEYDPSTNELLVRIESAKDFPNYYTRNLKTGQLNQLTFFENPFKSLQNVHKEVINYKRDDGLDLSGTLYLPVGYDLNKKEKVPMIVWAYPREYKNKASAGQNTKNPNQFTFPYYGSMVYWVTRGYAVLDGASFPIVGEGDEEPNDSFRKQLVANGKAAIDAVDKLGYIDRNRVGVGGHSYGAFMVANLLSHCDYFAAGIARSGAYNRTLTPFGFQSEERSYWDSPEVYNTMSPFMHADKMNQPLLLIHGKADNNSGTYPMQSERYFNALKGLGATTRLVMFPKESHGYRAKETILHLLWEQDQWLEKYVKNRK